MPVFAEKQAPNNVPERLIINSDIEEAEEVEEIIDNTGEVLEEIQNVVEPIFGAQVQNQEQEQELGVSKARNTNQLREMIQTKKAELKSELNEFKSELQQKVFRNQNTIREAVHTFLSSEDLIGGIGKQVSEIAQEFNNSVQKTIQAEEKIQKRSKFIKFLIGGVKDTAQELKQEVLKNKEKIQELKGLEEQNFTQTEIKELLQEQIQNLEQEQNRLGQLADKEISKKGIFGWLINLFK